MSDQSRVGSAVESAANIAIGFALSLAVWSMVGPIYGYHGTHLDNAEICAIFTAVSFLRSYALRRAFNWIHGG